MEIKKSEKYDLEKKKPVYMQIGLVLALSLALFSFEYKSYDKLAIDDGPVAVQEVIEEVVMKTVQETKPEPPPAAQPQTTLLNIVDNNVKVDNDIELSTEDDGEKNKEYQEVTAEVAVEAEEAEIFTVVEEEPGYPGGEEARVKFLSENLKYPPIARESNIEGTVYIGFVVEPSGAISKLAIKRDIGGGCGDAALDVVKKMPKWSPGKQRGKAVRTAFTMPITFKLR